MGVGRQSAAGEGLTQLPRDSQSRFDKDLLIVFFFPMAPFFQDVFFFVLVLFSGHRIPLKPSSPAAHPPPPRCSSLRAHVCFTWPLTPCKPYTV